MARDGGILRAARPLPPTRKWLTRTLNQRSPSSDGPLRDVGAAVARKSGRRDLPKMED